MRNLLGERAANLVGIETKADPVSAIESAEAIYVGGGNSFLLVRELHEMGLIEPIRKLVLSGAPYLGVSAGANVACPTVMTTNDMPIAHPESLDSLGVVPFQINPHYHPGKVLFMDGEGVSKHYGESRAQRISEFHKHRETPVLGMWEGSFVNWDGHRGRLTGRATAFRVGLEPKELTEGSVFDSGLMTIGHDE
jgi:dipeptidase E